MPSLEAQIAAWKARWRAWLPPGRDDVLVELEDHLRTSLEDLRCSGLTADSALSEAIVRLGDPADIGPELAKVPLETRPWLPARIVVTAGLVLAAAALWSMAPRVATGGAGGLLAAHIGLLALGYLATSCAGLVASLFLVIRLLHDPLPAQKRMLRTVVFRASFVAVVLVGAGLAISFLSSHHDAGGRLRLNAYQIGAAAIFVANLAMLIGHRRHPHGSRIELRMLLGVAANVAVIFGLVGAILVERPSTISGGSPWLVILLTSQALVVAAALAPANCLQIRKVVNRWAD